VGCGGGERDAYPGESPSKEMTLMHPVFNPLEPFDLEARAENGLRRGFTTGTSAAAATKAALSLLDTGVLPQSARVSLPDGLHYIDVPISEVPQDIGWSCASVVKDGGDDPDQTHRARIVVRVRKNEMGIIQFLRGSGVGLVTQPGLRIPIGQPAINAVPRAMIRQAVFDVLETDATEVGIDIEVGCENGEAIASRTFNPRLGIVGGISILGTTGIVEPKSLASFMASIEVYIRVALGDSPEQIVLSPGNLGQRFARAFLKLPLKQIVQMSNFAGFSLECISETLRASEQTLPLLWLVGHPGKLAKILNDIWDTHSHRSEGAIVSLWNFAKQFYPNLEVILAGSNSCETAIERLTNHPQSAMFWRDVEAAIARKIAVRLQRVGEVRVRLFAMDGAVLGDSL